MRTRDRLIVALCALGLFFEVGCPGGPPRMQSCRGAGDDFSGVTQVRIVGASVESGLQGGSHFQFEIEAEGTNLPSCVGQRSELISGGTVTSTVDSPVRAVVGSGSLRTELVYHFDGFGSATLMRVETLGWTLEEPIPRGGRDAGDPFFDASVGPTFDAAAPPLDAGPDDAGSEDAGL